MEVLEKEIYFSKFTVVDGIVSVSEKENLINFFSNINISIEEITSELERENHQKVVRVKYSFSNQEFITKPLYYKNILYADSVKDVHSIIKYFEDQVYWLDIEKHDWPKPKGQTDIDNLIINDMTDDDNFKKHLKLFGNNLNMGNIQRITKEGRSNQYYRNLENNNHWHDLIMLIKEYIKSNGEEIDKKYFKHLVFKWDGNKNTERLRSSLSPNFGNRALIEKLKENIKLYKSKDLNRKEMVKPIIDLLKYKNQILYGPPGTGKTYKLKDEYFKHFIIREISQTREQFLSEFVSTLTWWQIITIVLLDLKKGKVLDIHNHELIQAKEQISSSKTVRPTIWGQLQSHTVLTCEYVKVADRAEPLYFYKNAESYWTIIEEELKEKFPEAYNLYDTYINHEASPDVEIHNYDFVTFHQSFSYEDFVEGIKPVLDDNTVGGVKFRVEDGVFKRICEKAKRDPSNNYALFIDEINRGNVSAIFGELITLIEESKRIGYEESIEVTLPYSKEKFSVPSNLYIIGTMNTADRSVEALDTALRRRFVFEEMLPKPDLKELDYEVYGYKASAILKRINLRIEKLLDRDHCIGHAYFIGKNEDTIIDSFYKNIIPLLQEYFFGDYGKIGLVLGKGFVRLKQSESALFADFNYEYKEDLENRTVYEIIDYRNGTVDVKGFGQAIAALMNNG